MKELFLSFLIFYSLPGHINCYSWREGYYVGMPIDHFSISGIHDSDTFDVRYLINDTWWNPNGGPIFFVPGSEGAVDDFAQNSGLLWDWAPEFGAMLVFVEHRFYGNTLPYGNLSFSMPHMKTLTVDQAMADFAMVLQQLKENITNHGSGNSNPVIAFGGSYGGMLAAWMRLKYPNLVHGAIASSAPIRQLIGGAAPCWGYASTATQTFADVSPGCEKVIIKSWEIILNGTASIQGRKMLGEIFHVCDDVELEARLSLNRLVLQISFAWQYLAMFNYPYAADMFKPLPAWPVKEACKHVMKPAEDDKDVLRNIFEAVNLFYNYTGKVQCLPATTRDSEKEVRAWTVQTCTEIVWPICSNESHVLVANSWNESLYYTKCQDVLRMKPRGEWLTKNYGVENLKFATNIIFSNSQFDPWHDGGVTEEDLKGADPSLVVIDIPNAAHHYDLRANHPNDTKEILEVRNRMKTIARGWLDAQHAKPSNSVVNRAFLANCLICLIALVFVVL